MTKIKIRIISVTLLVSMSLSTPSLATNTIDTLEKDKKDIQQEVESRLTDIEETSRVSKKIQEEIKVLDKQVIETYDELVKVEVELEELEVDIDDNLILLNKSKDIQEEKQEIFETRLQVMYMNGNVGYLELLLSSKDIKDFFSRMDMVKIIAEQDKKLLKTMANQNKTREKKNSELITQRESLSKMKSSVEEKSIELVKASTTKSELIRELDLDVESLKEEYNVLNGLSDNIDVEIIKLEEEQRREEQIQMMSTPISTQSDIIDKLNNLRDGYDSVKIDFTIPYVFGGNSSTAKDCSSFTMDVYRQLGIKLPRTSEAQSKVGQKVNLVDLKPGDLVIFSGTYRSGPSHTGIYLGSGEFIHQSSYANGTIVSNLTGYYGKHFSCGRRLW